MKKCSYPDGYTFKPDSVNELDPCRYVEEERYENVTVSVLKCKKCGHVSIQWYRQPDTVEVDIE